MFFIYISSILFNRKTQGRATDHQNPQAEEMPQYRSQEAEAHHIHSGFPTPKTQIEHYSIQDHKCE